MHHIPSVGTVFRPEEVRGATAAACGPRVLLALHENCAPCATWRRTCLAGAEEQIVGWGGQILMIQPGDHAATGWVAITDEWDEVFHIAEIGPGHDFPEPGDLIEWVRFVAIQCPECEAPEGPWRL